MVAAGSQYRYHAAVKEINPGYDQKKTENILTDCFENPFSGFHLLHERLSCAGTKIGIFLKFYCRYPLAYGGTKRLYYIRPYL